MPGKYSLVKSHQRTAVLVHVICLILLSVFKLGFEDKNTQYEIRYDVTNSMLDGAQHGIAKNVDI